jgi:hypothetical protein
MNCRKRKNLAGSGNQVGVAAVHRGTDRRAAAGYASFLQYLRATSVPYQIFTCDSSFSQLMRKGKTTAVETA